MKEHPTLRIFHHEDTKDTKFIFLSALRVFVANNKTGCHDHTPSKLLAVSDSPLRLKHFFLAVAGA